jgi:chromodomain-helicase-DNA-binding protein 4
MSLPPNFEVLHFLFLPFLF